MSDLDAQRFVKRIQNVHNNLADAIGNPRKVWCRQCGRVEGVDATNCLRHGWPKCCGYTQTIDPPESWWRPVDGYPAYEVNAVGQVRRAVGGQGATAGTVLRPGTDTRGYLHVTLYDGSGNGKSVRVHTLVARAFVGPRPSGHQVNHKNSDKADNWFRNLEYVTPSRNIEHAHEQRAIPGRRGAENGRAKLTADDVLAIHQAAKSGEPNKDIAKRFNVSKTTVDRIATGRTWKWLLDDTMTIDEPETTDER